MRKRRKLQVGVIGVAYRGTLPLKYLPREDAEIVALCDVNREALEKAARDQPSVRFVCGDYRDLLARAEIEAVFIMVRDPLHEEMACAALNAGKAVYLEKPMAITVGGCDRILETAYRTGSKLFIGHNLRYFPYAEKLNEVLRSGIIGEIQSIWVRHYVAYGSCYFHHWCSEQKNCTGLLLQKGAHDIDLIHELAGSYTEHVVGMGRLSVYNECGRRGPSDPVDREEFKTAWPPKSNRRLSPVVDIEDTNMLLLSMKNGVQAALLQCFYSPDTERNYVILGDRGKVEHTGHGGEEEIRVWTKRQTTPRSIPDEVIELRHDGKDHGGSDHLICRAFVDFLQEGKNPGADPIDARMAVATGVAGHESMRSGNRPVKIVFPPESLVEYFKNGQRKK